MTIQSGFDAYSLTIPYHPKHAYTIAISKSSSHGILGYSAEHDNPRPSVAGTLSQAELDAIRPQISAICSGFMTHDQGITLVTNLEPISGMSRAREIRTYVQMSHVSPEFCCYISLKTLRIKQVRPSDQYNNEYTDSASRKAHVAK
jgi:hypothetical protein